MQLKEYTDNDIAIQFEGTIEDGTAADESLVGKPTKKDLKNKNNQQLTQEEYQESRKQKNDSIFL